MVGQFSRRSCVFGMFMVFWGCSGSGSDPVDTTNAQSGVPVAALALQKPKDCGELKNYIVDSLIAQYTTIPRSSYYYCPAGSDTKPAPPQSGTPVDTVVNDPSAGTASGVAGTAPDDVSGTNNQEAGVNEGDVVKADERGIVYVLSGQSLVIAKGFPPKDMTTLKTVDLGGRGMQMFLDSAAQRLVVLARHDTPVYIADQVAAGTDTAIVAPISYPDVTVAVFYDVSDAKNPVMLDQVRFKGYFQDGRRIGGRLHLVLHNYFYPEILYQDQDVWNLQANYWQAVRTAQCEQPDAGPGTIAQVPAVVAAKQAFAAKVKALFATVSVENYLPTAQRQTLDGGLESVPFLACSDIQHPQVAANLGMEIIASMDTDGGNLAATAVVNNAWQTYASKNNLYLAETSWNWWWLRNDGSLPLSQTAIYKFVISDAKPVYEATGSVNGFPLNQFSFSEYNGALRVATTQNDWLYDKDADGHMVGRQQRSNNVFVLSDDNKGRLTVSGAVRGFGKDESIQSSRFFADRGFVTTYRAVDPLFTFDLSDPENPQLMGELEIPGFSRYMHAFDDNHIITIGRGTGPAGAGNGLQLQLFDVTDLRNPALLYEYSPSMPDGWSWSAAEYDYKAFTFYKPANLLAIPLQMMPSGSVGSADVFSGVAAYEVSLQDGFKELGRVDHSDLAYQYYCNSDVVLQPAYAPDCTNGWYALWAAPRRSVVMTSGLNVYLYTISDMGMKASDIADLNTTLGSILFPPQPYPWWIVGATGGAQTAVQTPATGVVSY